MEMHTTAVIPNHRVLPLPLGCAWQCPQTFSTVTKWEEGRYFGIQWVEPCYIAQDSPLKTNNCPVQSVVVESSSSGPDSTACLHLPQESFWSQPFLGFQLLRYQFSEIITDDSEAGHQKA